MELLGQRERQSDFWKTDPNLSSQLASVKHGTLTSSTDVPPQVLSSLCSPPPHHLAGSAPPFPCLLLWPGVMSKSLFHLAVNVLPGGCWILVIARSLGWFIFSYFLRIPRCSQWRGGKILKTKTKTNTNQQQQNKQIPPPPCSYTYRGP